MKSQALIEEFDKEEIDNIKKNTYLNIVVGKEKNDSDFLEVIQEYDKYNEPKIPDYDLIN